MKQQRAPPPPSALLTVLPSATPPADKTGEVPRSLYDIADFWIISSPKQREELTKVVSSLVGYPCTILPVTHPWGISKENWFVDIVVFGACPDPKQRQGPMKDILMMFPGAGGFFLADMKAYKEDGLDRSRSRLRNIARRIQDFNKQWVRSHWKLF